MKQSALAFPWGVCIGVLPEIKGKRMDALLPTGAGGICLTYAHDGENDAIRVMETAVLSLFNAVPCGMAEVHIIDFSIKKRFAYLARLGEAGRYKLYGNVRQSEKFWADLEETARYRYHELLGNGIDSVSQYNQQQRIPVPYILVLLNLDDFPLNDKSFSGCLKLLQSAADAGIYCIAYGLERAEEDNERIGDLRRYLGYPKVFVGERGKISVDKGNCSLTQAWLDKTAGRVIGLEQAENLERVIESSLAVTKANDDAERYFLSVPIGYSMDGRNEIYFRMGAGNDCYSAFIVGMSGTGKTSLINNLLLQIAERYDSSQLRLYLMDYKDGVEFNVFDGHPNCEKIFLDNSNIAAATELLESFAATIAERAALFKSVDVRNLDEWNRKVSQYPDGGHTVLPRLLLVADEVQRLFSDDRNGRYFAELLKDVVRRGRSLGVHIILSTQTLIGSINIDRTLMSQIAMRIAFKLNNVTDCEKILDMGNHAPMHLDKFQFILNQNNGFRDANIRVQAFSAPQTQEIRQRLAEIAAQRPSDKRLIPLVMQSDAVTTPTEPLRTSLFPQGREVLKKPSLDVADLRRGRVPALPEESENLS